MCAPAHHTTPPARRRVCDLQHVPLPEHYLDQGPSDTSPLYEVCQLWLHTFRGAHQGWLPRCCSWRASQGKAQVENFQTLDTFPIRLIGLNNSSASKRSSTPQPFQDQKRPCTFLHQTSDSMASAGAGAGAGAAMGGGGGGGGGGYASPDGHPVWRSSAFVGEFAGAAIPSPTPFAQQLYPGMQLFLTNLLLLLPRLQTHFVPTRRWRVAPWRLPFSWSLACSPLSLTEAPTTVATPRHCATCRCSCNLPLPMALDARCCKRCATSGTRLPTCSLAMCACTEVDGLLKVSHKILV